MYPLLKGLGFTGEKPPKWDSAIKSRQSCGETVGDQWCFADFLATRNSRSKDIEHPPEKQPPCRLGHSVHVPKPGQRNCSSWRRHRRPGSAQNQEANLVDLSGLVHRVLLGPPGRRYSDVAHFINSAPIEASEPQQDLYLDRYWLAVKKPLIGSVQSAVCPPNLEASQRPACSESQAFEPQTVHTLFLR